MVRIQVQLEPAQHRRVKKRAKRLGVSVAEVIRRSVDAHLSSEEPDEAGQRARRLAAVAGKYADPSGDRRVAAGHDAALGGAFAR